MAFSQGLAGSLALHLAVAASCLGVGTFSGPELLSTSSGSVFHIDLAELGDASGNADIKTAAAPSAAAAEVAASKPAVSHSHHSVVAPPLRVPHKLVRAQKPISPAPPQIRPAEVHAAANHPAANNLAAVPYSLEASEDAKVAGATTTQGALTSLSRGSPGLGNTGSLRGAPGGGAGSPGSGPTLVRSPKPIYPSLARRANFEGRVVLEVLVDETGDVAEAHVAQSSGREDCDQSARETVLARWKFKPARLNGINVAWREKVAVSYQLR